MWQSKRFFSVLTLSFLIFSLLAPVFLVEKVEAAGFAQAYVRFDRLKATTPTSGLVCANPGTTSIANVDVQVTFPDENSATDFTVSGTAGNWAAVTTDIPAGTTAWPGIAAATATISGQTVTWTYTTDQTLNNGTIYCFRWTNTAALTTSSAGTNLVGTITTRTTAAATIDSSKYATQIISNDQIVVSATVPSTFSFSLPSNTDTFASALSTSAQASNGVTATIATNAAAGWIVWVKSANAALNSVSTGATIATAGSIDNAVTDVATTNGYFLDVAFTDSGNGTGTVTQGANYGQEYDGDATHGGTLSTTFQPVAASSGTTDGDTVVIKELARVSAVQAAAADYTDTLTVVAAGRF